MSDAESQNKPTMSDVIKAEMESDGEMMFGSEDNNELPSQEPINYNNRETVNQEDRLTDYQNDGTSSTGVTDSRKRDSEKVADGLKEKGVLITDGQQSNENGVHVAAHNAAAIIILPMSSRL